MEAPHPVPSLRREGPALLGAGAGYSRDFPEDADPAASPDGKRRHDPAERPPSGAAESRIWINRLGSGSMPGARRLAEMGSAARGNGRRSRRYEQGVKASLHRPSVGLERSEIVMNIPALVDQPGS